MRSWLILLLTCLACGLTVAQQPLLRKPADACFDRFDPLLAPKAKGLLLKKGDRIAICGDSITEQKMYSRMIEDYLTMCVPELEVSVRQYGWSGEKAPGFLARMTNDCLRFKPTVATTCYGMNDHEYRPYEDRIGEKYRTTSAAIIDAFKANHVRFVQGSPGCVGKMPSWVKTATGTVEDLNLNLCRLCNIGIEIALDEKVRFADVFWPMLTVGVEGQKRFGPDFAIAGKDGVHPGWAGHTVMAYAFLMALGVNGNLGTFIVDLNKNKMRTSAGHELLSAKDGEFQIRSARYPFCACVPENSTGGYPNCGQDDPTKDNSIRAAMALIPFNQDLNRIVLMARKGPARRYVVTWGTETRTFTAAELARGINLAGQFASNPFCGAFAKVDAAIAAKQAFETKQIKEKFHGPGARDKMESVVTETEKDREPLVAAVKAAFVPVIHTLRIVPQ